MGSSPIGVTNNYNNLARGAGVVAHWLPSRCPAGSECALDRRIFLGVGDGHVPHRRLDIDVPHQLLDGRQRHAPGGALRAERVPQRVPGHGLPVSLTGTTTPARWYSFRTASSV